MLIGRLTKPAQIQGQTTELQFLPVKVYQD